jgi:pyruvate,water dikinase
MIKTFLLAPEPHDFEAARRAAIAERDAAIDAARSRLTVHEQAVFDAGLAACTAANFSWWQDDHNYYIDLKVSLPMRWACQAIAERIGADAPDDTIFLFWPENLALVEGRKTFREYRSIIQARRQYFDHWYHRRAGMPKMLGSIPDSVDDPILIEIFGLNPRFLATIQAAGTGAGQQPAARTLTGIPASKGTARGPARVLNSADDLHRIAPGEILVCESTSPNWTPAFAKIAGCVCDGGGTLSHAAIVGREYGVPTVTAVGLATVQIKDGDDVEVDGTTGIVTIHRAAEPDAAEPDAAEPAAAVAPAPAEV